MSGISTSHQVNDLGHPLGGRLRGYYWGPIPLVPWATSYGATNLDMTWFPPVTNSWGTMYPISNMVPPLLVDREKPPT
jgi:hypothetical protein